MNITSKNKIIGFAYISWHGDYFAADLYEGNMVRYPDGNVDAISPNLYDKYLAQYQRWVKEDKPIETAYEANIKMHKQLDFKIPDATADPKAAEKEMYMRRHPEEFREPEIAEPKKKGWFFGRKKKAVKDIVICSTCGAENDKGKNFCGECGAALLPKEEIKTETKAEVSAEPIAKSEAVNETREPLAEKPVEPEKMPKKAPDPVPVPAEEETEEEEILVLDEAVEDQIEISQSVPKPVVSPAKPKPVEPQAVATPKPEPEKKVVQEKPEKNVEQIEQVAPAVEQQAKKPKKIRIWMVLLPVLLLLLVAGTVYVVLIYGKIPGNVTVPASSGNQVVTPSEEEPYMAIMFTQDLSVDDVIEKEDLNGCILNKEQYEKYSNISTYIDEDGEEVSPELIPWSEVDSVVGKRVTSDVKSGALVYDTTITSQHVIAQKTYVDATVNGEDGTYEVDENLLPGNTKIQIVAVISTDGSDPVQVLLSEMTLKDRSLESIFNSAGQDILDKLAGGSSDEDTEETQEETDGAEEQAEGEE